MALALRADEYCERIVSFFCPFYVRCGRMAGVSTVSTCESVFLEQCNATYEPRYVDLEAAGLLALRVEGIAACAAHLEEVQCEEQVRDLDGPCAQMWQGTQPAGGPCAFDVESLVCAPGSACAIGLDLCGECRVVVPPGAPCGSAAVEPVSCGDEASCVDERCVAHLPVGEACASGQRCALGTQCIAGVCQGPVYVGLDEPCDQRRRCGYKSHCEAGVCVADALLGESCAETNCASGYCSMEGRCEPRQVPGSACTTPTECESGLCSDGVCQSLPGACFE
ncbi:MAG: hypothetical protein ACO3JL_11600 [Myxococcota bacterium]